MNYFEPQSPDPFIKKNEDQGLAKFGHLNAIVKTINTLGVTTIINFPNTDTIITPTNGNTIAIMTTPLGGIITIGVDISSSQLGDSLTIIFKILSSHVPKKVIFDSDFYLVQCGDPNNTLSLNGSTLGPFPERWLITFIFDGEKFINTFDNC